MSIPSSNDATILCLKGEPLLEKPSSQHSVQALGCTRHIPTVPAAYAFHISDPRSEAKTLARQDELDMFTVGETNRNVRTKRKWFLVRVVPEKKQQRGSSSSKDNSIHATTATLKSTTPGIVATESDQDETTHHHHDQVYNNNKESVRKDNVKQSKKNSPLPTSQVEPEQKYSRGKQATEEPTLSNTDNETQSHQGDDNNNCGMELNSMQSDNEVGRTATPSVATTKPAATPMITAATITTLTRRTTTDPCDSPHARSNEDASSLAFATPTSSPSWPSQSPFCERQRALRRRSKSNPVVLAKLLLPAHSKK